MLLSHTDPTAPTIKEERPSAIQKDSQDENLEEIAISNIRSLYENETMNV